MECPNCSKKLDRDSKFCQSCGQNVKKMFCSQCGKEAPSDSKFCRHCGHTLANSNNVVKLVSTSKDTSLDNKQVLSLGKFFLLTLVTLGVYLPYWGWKNWEIVKRVKGLPDQQAIAAACAGSN